MQNNLLNQYLIWIVVVERLRDNATKYSALSIILLSFVSEGPLDSLVLGKYLIEILGLECLIALLFIFLEK